MKCSVLVGTLGRGQGIREPSHLGLSLRKGPLVLTQDVVEAVAVGEAQALLEVAQGELRWVSADGAAIRLLVAQQNAEQRGLSATIRPNQTNTVARVDREGDALQDQCVTEVLGDIGCLKHATQRAGSWPTARAPRLERERCRCDDRRGRPGAVGR